MDLVRIFRVLIRITIRKRPPKKGGISVRLSGRSLVKKMPLRVGLRDFIVVRVIRIKKVRSLALVVLLFLTRETVWR